MSKKLLVVVAVVAVAAAAYWILGRGSDKPPDLSGLPPVHVDEARLTEAGKNEYKRLLKTAGRIKRVDAVRRFDLGQDVAGTLHKLGDYEGAIQWHLKLAEWFEELSPKQRKATERGQRGEADHTVVAATCYQTASSCCFLLGDEARGVQLMETFLRKYPRDSQGVRMMRLNWESAKGKPEMHREMSQTYKADPKYVKDAAR